MVVWLVVSYLGVRHYVKRPMPMFKEWVPKPYADSFEALRLHTRDGQEIGAWFVEGKADVPIVIILHGKGGCRSAAMGDIDFWREMGCAVMALSLRCYGDSTGEADDFGFSARYDVLAAVDWLEPRANGRPIVLNGRSMGAAAAVFAAKELDHRVHGYVLESLYSDLRTAARNRTRMHLPPVIEWIGFQGMVLTAPLLLPKADDIAPVRAIADIPADIPVLLLTGERDRHATSAESRLLFERVRSHGQLEVFGDGGHNVLRNSDGDRYRILMQSFLDKCCGPMPD